MPSSLPAKPYRMMSLPLLVIVVWFWRPVHVTICALLLSPESSQLGHQPWCPYPHAGWRESLGCWIFRSPETSCISSRQVACGSVVVLRGAKAGRGAGPRGGRYSSWRRNVCTAPCLPARPGPPCTVLRGSLSSCARWAGDERGHWRVGMVSRHRLGIKRQRGSSGGRLVVL